MIENIEYIDSASISVAFVTSFLTATGSLWGTSSYALSASYAPAPAGSAVAGQVEVDFGTTPVPSATFTSSLAGVTVSSIIIAQTAWVAPTGKDIDEIEMDTLDIRCQSGTDLFYMYITS